MRYGALYSVTEEEELFITLVKLSNAYNFEKGPHHPDNDSECSIAVGSNQIIREVDFRFSLHPCAEAVDSTAMSVPSANEAYKMFKETHSEEEMKDMLVTLDGAYIADTDVGLDIDASEISDFLEGSGIALNRSTSDGKDELTEKLRLFPGEWVHCSSILEAVHMAILADELGRRRDDGSLYLNNLSYGAHTVNSCYNLYTGACSNAVDLPIIAGGSVISATEWLNRHNKFVHGQQVIVWHGGAAMGTRIYLHGLVCVVQDDEGSYRNTGGFETYEWEDISPTTPTWDALRTVVKEKGTKHMLFDVELSEAQYHALRDAVLKIK